MMSQERAVNVDAAAVRAYRWGLKDMAWWLAVNKDGQLLVGVRQQPLSEVRDEIDQGKWDLTYGRPVEIRARRERKEDGAP